MKHSYNIISYKLHTNITYNSNPSFHTSLPNLQITLVTWNNNKYDTEVFFLINSTLLEKLAELFSSQFTRTAYILHALFSHLQKHQWSHCPFSTLTYVPLIKNGHSIKATLHYVCTQDSRQPFRVIAAPPFEGLRRPSGSSR